MTHEKLLAKIKTPNEFLGVKYAPDWQHVALLAVVELHKPNENDCCTGCPYDFEWDGHFYSYPCPTIQAIQKELE